MPLTQDDPKFDKGLKSYTDPGSSIIDVNNQFDPNTLKKLKAILKPVFVTEQEANRPKCLKGTRVDLLQQIRIWAQRTDFPNVFTLTGKAGTGKSTVARTIAE
ncbi:vegetative incompatibility HET-E-1 [Pyrrhoderma noxium]|uniref:Vegetative incompatibility HET-E-1 n=1 Tax=Pyrrhoderma noxium TaxID=2282107 RepID=A0A286U5N6_9AGAM|nr:vegetative incompatibility HET-E-1 [Pyrrhoderma noxium]